MGISEGDGVNIMPRLKKKKGGRAEKKGAGFRKKYPSTKEKNIPHLKIKMGTPNKTHPPTT
jgi:hypothetical protein